MTGYKACFLFLLVLTLGWSRIPPALAARPELLAGVARHSRKLLACYIQAPQYQPPGEKSLPLCATQFFPDPSASNAGRDSSSSWIPVTRDTPHPTSKATAADLAVAWAKDPSNPRTDSSLQCYGEVTDEKQECWAGKGVETDVTFKQVSCCSTTLVCYIKSGGCVLH